MYTPIMPVANGILPRPTGGKISGVFLMEQGGQTLLDLGCRRDVLICPWVVDDQSLYRVGVVARILDVWSQTVQDGQGQEIPVVMAVLEGRGHARWHNLRSAGANLVTSNLEFLDLRTMRKDYPVISGAGWLPAGGFTEFRDKGDIPVTIYGTDLETGKEVSVRANLGRLVEQEQAHTIEHAIIRALRTYGLCTPRNLAEAMQKETTELKQSVEYSIKFSMPEILGVTSSGICGNPMTNLAQFYLAREFVDNLEAGRTLDESLNKARRATMSQLAQDLGITTQQGLRALQGLKKGMSHDDTLLKLDIYKKVIGRFPMEPWG